MKFWLLPSLLILATSCSHSSTKTEAAAPAKTEAKAEAKKETKAEAPAKKTKAEAKTAAASEGATDHASCKSGSDERLIEIVTKGSGCAVEYTKSGEKKEIASAEHETEHCKQVLQKVRGKLEAANFTCN